MQIIMKINKHQKDTNVSVYLSQNLMQKNMRIKRRIFLLKFYFASQRNKPHVYTRSTVIVAIDLSKYS